MKKILIGLLMVAAGAVFLLRLAGRADAAVPEPAHVHMLVCSTESSDFSILAQSATDPALRIEQKGGCAAALRAVAEAGYDILDVEYGDGGRRVTYTSGNPVFAARHQINRSKSNVKNNN